MIDPAHSAAYPHSHRRGRWLMAIGALLLSAGVLVAQDTARGQSGDRATQESGEQEFDGTSKPSKEMDLAFANLGRVSEVPVKEGDVIEKGQLLMKQDARSDEARLRGLEAEADVTARIKLAETQSKQARVDLKRMEEGGTAFTDSEKEKAQLEVEASDTRIVVERNTGLAAEAKAEEQRIIIEEKSLTSPEPGVIQQIEAAVGEVFGPQTAVVRIVRIDPLHVEFREAPASAVQRLKIGDTVQVRYASEQQWVPAKVVFIDPVGVAESFIDRLLFRVELPNPDGRPAGARLKVRLPGTDQQAAGR